MAERAAPGLKAWVASILASATSICIVGAITALQQVDDPPTCYGIGWGCSPGPFATAFLYGFFVVVPGLLGATVLLVLTALPRSERARRHGALAVAVIVWALAIAVPLWAHATGQLR